MDDCTSTSPLGRRKFLTGMLTTGVLAFTGAIVGKYNLPEVIASHPGVYRWQITVDDKIIKEGKVSPELTEEISIPVKNGVARVIFDHGRIYLPEDNDICPKKICSLMGSITRPGEKITCLPNKLVVSVV